MMNSYHSISEALAISRAFFKTEKLRTLLTCIIIAVGIASLTGSVMAVNSLSHQIESSFNRLGAGLVSVLPSHNNASVRKINSRQISLSQALDFGKLCNAGTVSVYEHYRQPAYVSYNDHEVSDVILVAVDPFFFSIRNLGNPFTYSKFNGDTFVCIISNSLARRLSISSAEMQFCPSVSLLSSNFTVLGLVDESAYNPGSENFILIPSRLFYCYIERSRNVQIEVSSCTGIVSAYMKGEIESSMRIARRLRPYDSNDFVVSDNRLLGAHSSTILRQISNICIAVAIVALIGASVALMNTLLVGLNARKREIGLYMALGANKSFIRFLFMTEAFLYGITGGLFGVMAGILVGYSVSAVLTADYVLPTGWILSSFVISLLVCLLSSCIPSEKAAKLSPVKALSSR